MTGILATHLRRRIAAATILVWVVLTAMIQIVSLLDASADILERNLGALGILHYIMLNTPAELVLTVPLAALIGPMFGFYALARSQEAVAIRAAGISLRRVVLWLLPVPLLLAAVQFAIADRLVPPAQTAMVRWWQLTQPPRPEASKHASMWLHLGTDLVYIGNTASNGRELTNVRVFQRDANALLVARMTADSARWLGHRWRLSNACSVRVDGNDLNNALHKQCQKQRWWGVHLTPGDLLHLQSPEPQFSGVALVQRLHGGQAEAYPASYYQTQLVHLFTKPLATLVMLLLALPALRIMQRSGRGAASLVVALGLGLGYVLIDGLLGAMAGADRLSPLAAGVAPVVVFGAIGLFQLRRADR